jgi:aminoglycoside phosphotransferase (APT) family kinase protein
VRYLAHLRAARDKMVASLRSGRFPRHEADVLAAIVSLCDTVEARWALVGASCEDAPHTLVHGDLRPKNAYIRANGAGLSLFPIDWETAGFGPPATDLPRIDLRTYWCVVRDGWPQLGFDAVERLAATGRLLWELAAINWESEALRSETMSGRSHAVLSLDAVLGRLTTAARAAGVAG